MKPRVNLVIPNNILFRKKVGIYCRVSTKSDAQLHSISEQIAGLTATVAANSEWELVNVYIDIKSGINLSGRDDLKRLMADAREHRLDIVLIKSCSRFFRNVSEALSVLHELHELGVCVHFDSEGMNTDDPSFWLYVSVFQTSAEHINRVRGDSIRWGIKESVKNGTSGLFDRKCYGYTHDENGHLVIEPEQAAVVRLIFDLYLSGYSIVKIIRELEHRGIPSPTGKETWCKRSIDTMLTNSKYTGNAVALKSTTEGYEKKKRVVSKTMYCIENDHEAIISEEDFMAVQNERARRSNVIVDSDGQSKRKSTKYSSKNKLHSE